MKSLEVFYLIKPDRIPRTKRYMQHQAIWCRPAEAARANNRMDQWARRGVLPLSALLFVGGSAPAIARPGGFIGGVVESVITGDPSPMVNDIESETRKRYNACVNKGAAGCAQDIQRGTTDIIKTVPSAVSCYEGNTAGCVNTGRVIINNSPGLRNPGPNNPQPGPGSPPFTPNPQPGPVFPPTGPYQSPMPAVYNTSYVMMNPFPYPCNTPYIALNNLGGHNFILGDGSLACFSLFNNATRRLTVYNSRGFLIR